MVPSKGPARSLSGRTVCLPIDPLGVPEHGTREQAGPPACRHCEPGRTPRRDTGPRPGSSGRRVHDPSRPPPRERAPQRPGGTVTRGEDFSSVRVDDHDVVAVDDLADAAGPDRVPSGIRVPAEPPRQSARFGDGVPEAVERLDRPTPKADHQLRFRLLGHHRRAIHRQGAVLMTGPGRQAPRPRLRAPRPISTALSKPGASASGRRSGAPAERPRGVVLRQEPPVARVSARLVANREVPAPPRGWTWSIHSRSRWEATVVYQSSSSTSGCRLW